MRVKRGQDRRGRGLAGMIGSMLLMMQQSCFYPVLCTVWREDTAGDQETLKKAIARASVQCYAIEGRYPPSIEYLEEHYG